MMIILNPSPFDNALENCDLSKISLFLMNEIEGFQITGEQEMCIRDSSIPEDFAIVGYDNIEISGYVNPSLTTVDQDNKILGRTLWSVITEYNKTGKYQSIELPQKIKMRGSC